MAWTTPKTDWTAGVTKPTATLFNNIGNNLQYLKDSSDATDRYATTTNAGNAYSATLSPAPASYAAIEGKPFTLKFNADSTGAITINLNSLGAKNVYKGNGSTFTNAKNNSVYTFIYNGTNFILQGSDSSGDATAADIRSGKTCTTDAGEVTGTLAVKTGDNAASAYSMATTTIKLTPPAGIYDGSTDKVTKDLTAVDADLTAANIKTGVEVLGITGTFTNDANAADSDIANGKTAYVLGVKRTGTKVPLEATGSVTVTGTYPFSVVISGLSFIPKYISTTDPIGWSRAGYHYASSTKTWGQLYINGAMAVTVEPTATSFTLNSTGANYGGQTLEWYARE